MFELRATTFLPNRVIGIAVVTTIASMLFVNLKLHNQLMQSVETVITVATILAITLCVIDLRPLKRGMTADRFVMISSDNKFLLFCYLI